MDKEKSKLRSFSQLGATGCLLFYSDLPGSFTCVALVLCVTIA